MINDLISYIILVCLLVVSNGLQFWFWSRQNQKLVDKLMSRNYGEYVSLTKTQEENSQELVPMDLHGEAEETDQLRELNGVFGL